MGDDHRGLRRAQPVAAPMPVAGSRWAVVIGVSEYQDPRLNLRFAAQDAEDLAALIRTPNGGAFPDENVLLLTDRQATSREVTRALRSFLTRPAPEDLVLIYLACHGGPDPRRPTGPLYLLTHDTEYADIAGTAVPMDEIDGALRGLLLSERVVVIADTCHSGELGGSGRRSVASAEVTNRYLNRLADSKTGVALLTSCESAESSQEDARWGGGHGVFTWHLLEGMRGAADGFGGRERDGIVSVGELFEYVRDRVRADTQGQQHPSVGAAPFDRNLPMAVTGDLDTQRHLTLARHLIELGWLTDDPAAFACAAREAEVAHALAALTGTHLPHGRELRAEALLAAGRAEEAVVALGAAAPGESRAIDLIRGVALTVTGDTDDAAAALRRYAVASPTNEEARWAGDYASALVKGSTGNAHALLVGAGTVASLPEHSHLRGPSNDVAALADHLVNTVGFPAANVMTLTGPEASRAAMVDGLNTLSTVCGPGDTVVVYFSGHSTSTASDDDAYFVMYDTYAQDGAWVDGIGGAELAGLIARIPGATRLLVLDCRVTGGFERRMTAQSDWVVISSRTSGTEVSFDDVVYSTLTRTLLDTWPQHGGVTVRDFVKRARHRIGNANREFDPQLVALGAETTLTPALSVGRPRLWWLARDRSASDAMAHELEAAGPSVTAYGHGKWAKGRKELRTGASREALRSLDAARRQLGSSIAALEIDRARALLALGRTTDALAALTENPAIPSQWPEGFAAAAAAVADLAACRGRALVVGIDEYGDPAVPAPSGARADAESFAATLTSRGIVAADDIVLLLDAQATRDAILAEFDTLAEHGTNQLAIFHFAGVGSWAASGPTLLTADTRTTRRSIPTAAIALADLATRAANSPNLVAVIDAGSPALPQPARASDGRFAPPAPGSRTANPPADYLADSLLTSSGDDPVVGAVSLFARTPKRSKDPSLEVQATPQGPVRGRLTSGLENALQQKHDTHAQREPLTYTGLVQRTGLRSRAFVAGPAAGEPLFRHRTATASADEALRELELRPARAILTIANQLMTEAEARSDSEPRAYLEAGLAHDALGDHAAALPLLRAARSLAESGSGSTGRAPTTDPKADEWRAWACYHLGRILYQHGGDLNEAVAALRAAHHASPDEARTSFHLAQAIKALIDRESLREVSDHLRRYLALGAPIGEVDQVRNILSSIR